MSEVLEKKRKVKSKPNDLSEIQNFISQLSIEIKPSLHINGAAYSNCVLTVDFGEPLNPCKISEEEEEILKEKMKLATKNILGKNVSVRVSKDSIYNIWWASVG